MRWRHAGSVWTASKDEKALVNVGGGDAADELLKRTAEDGASTDLSYPAAGACPSWSRTAVTVKWRWKKRLEASEQGLCETDPAVPAGGCLCRGDVFSAYPVVHLLRKKARAGACHGRARRGADPRADSVRFLDGTCRRRAKSAMILMQCGICFREFLLPAKRQENQIDIPRRNG